MRTLTGDFRNLSGAYCGPDSSVGIATDYGLDGPGSNPNQDDHDGELITFVRPE